jgi:3-oxoacyl-[acyl-carrier protein] reductase
MPRGRGAHHSDIFSEEGAMRFKDKIAIITGAGQGIGEAYASALAADGAKVVVADLNETQADRVAKVIEAAGGAAIAVKTDVADPESAEAMAAAAVEAFGGIDYLVNNAAIYGGMQIEALTKVDLDYYRRFMSVNMDGALHCTRAVHRAMRERGGGAIVNQSSTAAWMAGGFYSLAKAALNALTVNLAAELGWMGIRVNSIAPGPTDTEATRKQAGSASKELLKGLALKRMGQPQDMVGACLFLLSDEAAWVTGQILNVDGGQVFRS